MELYELKEEQEKVILVGVQTRENDDTEDSLEELKELVKTAGAEVLGTVIQAREAVHPGYYVGTGKLDEIRMMIDGYGATGIVCDDELSPSQINNLERELQCKIMDRTMVILDIFAARANTSEGKIQVELAQLRYRAARLTGLGNSMSRLGGGIGTRGPGEKKLEMDRRLLEEDKLFATLVPTTRILELPGKQKLYLTDTVGFIRKLPHHLIEAFKSTLEEAKYADFIIHVVDVSNPQREKQMFVVYETLQELGVEDKKVVTLFNKQDKLQDEETIRDFKADYIVKTAIKTGQGLEELKEVLEKILTENQIYLERILDYQEAGQIQLIRKYGQLISEEYTDKGIEIKARVPQNIYGKIGGR